MRRPQCSVQLFLAAGACAAVSAATFEAARAADAIEITASIKGHKSEPTQLNVPAGKDIKLTVKNLDATAEEFERNALKVEKVLTANCSAVILIKPLAKGTDRFVGEYHEATAAGTLNAE